MESEHHKNELKRKIKGMNVKQLQELFIELEKEKMNLGHTMRTKEGSSMYVRNYPKQLRTDKFGNYKRVCKDIARVQTMLTIRLNGGQNG